MANEWKEKMEASANRLREIRLNMGVSQEQFAEYLDISLSAYKKIESADNGISVNVLRRLRVILSILVYTFFPRMFDLMLPLVMKHSIVPV